MTNPYLMIAKHVIGEVKKVIILIDGTLYHEGGEFPDKCRLVVPCIIRLLMNIMTRALQVISLRKCESCVSFASVVLWVSHS